MTTGPESSVSVVVLAKDVREAKSRLGLGQGPAEEIALALARRTLRAALAAKSIGLVVVVTSDPTIRRDATGMGVEAVWEGRPIGMNRAAAAGREHALRRRPQAPVAVLVADLPRLGPRELDLAVEEFRRTNAPMFVADHTGEGTTLLIHGPDSRPGIGFGRYSPLMHSRLGYEPSQGKLDGLRVDLDTPEDLEAMVGGRAASSVAMSSTLTHTSSATATASLCRSVLERATRVPRHCPVKRGQLPAKRRSLLPACTGHARKVCSALTCAGRQAQ